MGQQASDITGDSYDTNSYTLTNINRSELANVLSVELVSYYKALALSSTQYLRNLKAVITWTPAATVKKPFLGGEQISKAYVGGVEITAAFLGSDEIYKI